MLRSPNPITLLESRDGVCGNAGEEVLGRRKWRGDVDSATQDYSYVLFVRQETGIATAPLRAILGQFQRVSQRKLSLGSNERARVAKGGLSALLALALCAGCVQAASSPPLSPADVSKPWTRLYVPEADGTERVIATPQGYFALTRQTIGEPRAPSGWSSYLYRSNDGVRWQQILRHQREVLLGFAALPMATAAS